MKPPRYMLIAYSEAKAQAFVKAFGLDPADWYAIGVGSFPAGRVFEKVVVLRCCLWIRDEASEAWRAQVAEFLGQMRCRLRNREAKWIEL